MRTLRYKTDKHKGREAKIIQKQGEGQNIRDSKTENKLRLAGGVLGGGWAKWMRGIKEDTCCNEQWVLYVSDKSLNSTPETITTLYVN